MRIPKDDIGESLDRFALPVERNSGWFVHPPAYLGDIPTSGVYERHAGAVGPSLDEFSSICDAECAIDLAGYPEQDSLAAFEPEVHFVVPAEGLVAPEVSVSVEVSSNPMADHVRLDVGRVHPMGFIGNNPKFREPISEFDAVYVDTSRPESRSALFPDTHWGRGFNPSTKRGDMGFIGRLQVQSQATASTHGAICREKPEPIGCFFRIDSVERVFVEFISPVRMGHPSHFTISERII